MAAPTAGWFAFPPPPPGPAPAPPWAGYPLAGFGRRLGGSVVDSAVVGLFHLPAFIVLFVGPWRDRDASFPDDPFREVPTTGTIVAAVVLVLLAYAAALAYYSLPVAKRGATFGGRLVGCRVIDLGTGGPPSRLKALGRYLLGAFISGNLFYLSHLWMLWDPGNQTLHDKVCNTIVVEA